MAVLQVEAKSRSLRPLKTPIAEGAQGSGLRDDNGGGLTIEKADRPAEKAHGGGD